MSEFNNSVEPFIEQDPMHLHERDSDQDDGSARAAKDPGYDIPLKNRGMLPEPMMGFGPLLLPGFPPTPQSLVTTISSGVVGSGVVVKTITLPPGIWIAVARVTAGGIDAGTDFLILYFNHDAGLVYENTVDPNLNGGLSVTGLFPGGVLEINAQTGATPDPTLTVSGFVALFKLA